MPTRVFFSWNLFLLQKLNWATKHGAGLFRAIPGAGGEAGPAFPGGRPSLRCAKAMAKSQSLCFQNVHYSCRSSFKRQSWQFSCFFDSACQVPRQRCRCRKEEMALDEDSAPSERCEPFDGTICLICGMAAAFSGRAGLRPLPGNLWKHSNGNRG